MGQGTAQRAWENPVPWRGGGSSPLARKAWATEQVGLGWPLEVGAALTPRPPPPRPDSGECLGWAEIKKLTVSVCVFISFSALESQILPMTFSLCLSLSPVSLLSLSPQGSLSLGLSPGLALLIPVAFP